MEDEVCSKRRELDHMEKDRVRVAAEHFLNLASQNPALDNGVSACLYFMSVAFEQFQTTDLSLIQQELDDMGCEIYLMGVPIDTYVAYHNKHAPQGQTLIVSDVFFPQFKDGSPLPTQEPTERGQKHALFATVRLEEKVRMLQAFGLSEDQNLENLRDVGMISGEFVVSH